MRTNLFFLAIASLTLTACGADMDGDDDAGMTTIDSGLDASFVFPDAGPEIKDGDAGDLDAGVIEDDAGTDAGEQTDAGAEVDAGSEDAGPCIPPVCPAPPDGCSWVGGGLCSCGTLECPTDDCGGARCNGSEYCEYDPGVCGGAGTCQSRPEICFDLWMPVCGCDGNDYGNSCEANAGGTDVAFDGECPVPTGDCRTTGCGPSESCEICRGIGGAIYVCLPAGAVC